MLIIGLDVATKKTGWACFYGIRYKASGVFDSDTDHIDFFSDKINIAIGNIWNEIKQSFKQIHDTDILLVVETSIIYNKGKNGISVKTSEKLSMFVGAYIALFKLYWRSFKVNISVKMVGPSSWTNFLGWKGERAELKSKSLENANRLTKGIKDIISDDEADAINIARYGAMEEIKDFWTISHHRQEIKHKKVSLTSKIKKSEAMLAKYNLIVKEKVKQGKKPTKLECDMIERHTKLLEDYKNERSKL